ncbi:MAG TPA: hypothetical protein VEU95_03720 [Micropepsaceae bacterium]|nr:hypothetical protein [Micropepsaceae bacterium]
MSGDADRANSKPPSLDRLSLLWRRINDHKIAQWSVAYVALAYGVQHGVILTSESFEWPNAVARISMLLLALGLPVVMTFAWYHGERASRRISGPELTIISILLVIGSLFFYVFVRPSEQVAAGPAVQQASIVAARTAAVSPKGAISLAVLPFVNLSSDKEQEFFSDGMTEEITSALAKVPDLRVVARTSAFEFKGKNVNIKTMGDELGATHLIEGSVRKAGTRVRITVQLIKADDGTHIWSEDYNRELTDIFAIQEDIARAITTSLRMPLGLKPGENLVNNRAIGSEDYQQYLRANALILARGRARASEAASLLESIVSRNPNYAPAWWALGRAYYFIVNTDRTRNSGTGGEFRHVVDAYLPKIEAANRRAVEVDPNYPGGYSGLGTVQLERGSLLSADELWTKAFALSDPDEPRVLYGRGITLAIVGQMKEANSAMRQLHAVEPFVPAYNRWTALYLWVDGQNDAALVVLNASPPDAPNRVTDIAMIYASMGRYSEAADMLEKAPPGNNTAEIVKEAARLLRMAPASAPIPSNLPRLGTLDWVYLYAGAPERAIETYEYGLKSGFAGAAGLPLIWHSSYAPVRKTERFKAYVRALGLVDYWRAKGWPQWCHPTTRDDFACS